jgi:hypothetical protein
LEARVDRLLNPRVAGACSYWLVGAAASLPAVLLIAAMANPVGVHSLLERLIH